MEFVEYQHVVKLDDPEVEGLLVGKCYIFPKIDGTNASIWYEEGVGVQAGSRRRHLSVEGKDNAGFLGATLVDTRYDSFFADNPELRLYGEWLVPHTMKNYRQDAWRKFYVFDVCREDGTYIPYEKYCNYLSDYEIDVIPPLRIIVDPSHEDLLRVTQINTYLLEDGTGIGEGVVVKNYDFINQYGRIRWGKIVTNEFKDDNYKEMGAPERTNHLMEKELVENFLDRSLVDKIYSKIIILETGCINPDQFADLSFEKQWIPRLLEQSYHDFVTEEIWAMVKYIKKQKLRGIDFKNLRQHTMNKVKGFYPELFRRGTDE